MGTSYIIIIIVNLQHTLLTKLILSKQLDTRHTSSADRSYDEAIDALDCGEIEIITVFTPSKFPI